MLALIEKDIRLAGNYIWMSLIAAVIIPVFLSRQGSGDYSAIYIFIMALNFSTYFIFSNIFLNEDKYKGNVYMLALPFGKRRIVFAKYVLAIMSYLLAAICYTALCLLRAVSSKLSYSDISITFFLFTVILDVMFPLYFKFSYAKIKAVLFVLMIILPSWGLVTLKYMFHIELVYGKIGLSIGKALVVNILSIVFMVCSMKVSVRAFGKNSKQKVKNSI